jgi:hypothetical protein
MEFMRLTYETGVATMIQFMVLALFNIANTLYSIVSTCTHSGEDCVSNTLSSVIFYILIIFWYGILVGLGFIAQTKRSKRSCRILILAELSCLAVAAYDIKLGISYHNNALSSFTSFADLVLSAWVITLAFRLMKAGGGRVVTGRRRVVAHQSTDIYKDKDEDL